jgi:hypothetical protein
MQRCSSHHLVWVGATRSLTPTVLALLLFLWPAKLSATAATTAWIRGGLPPHSSRRPDPPRLQEMLLPHCNSDLDHQASNSVLIGLGEALPTAWSAGLPATQSRSPLLPVSHCPLGPDSLIRSLASSAIMFVSNSHSPPMVQAAELVQEQDSEPAGIGLQRASLWEVHFGNASLAGLGSQRPSDSWISLPRSCPQRGSATV